MLKTLLVPAVICVLATSALAGSADLDAWARNNQRMEEEKRQIKDTLETLRRLDAETKQREDEHAVQWCPSLGMNIELNDRCPPSR
jgi:hypothetical protein